MTYQLSRHPIHLISITTLSAATYLVFIFHHSITPTSQQVIPRQQRFLVCLPCCAERIISPGIAKNILGRMFKSISRLLESKQQLRQNAPVTDLMSRFCAQADIGKNARVKATEKGIVGGKAPTTVASASMFFEILRRNQSNDRGDRKHHETMLNHRWISSNVT